MEKYQNLLNQIKTMKQKNVSTKVRKSLLTLLLYELNNDFLILTPTPSNINFKNGLKSVYPNIVIYDNYEANCKNDDSFSLESLSLICRKQEPDFNEFFDAIKKIAIIIEKSVEVEEYISSIKLLNKISNSRSGGLKRLNPLNKFQYFSDLSGYLSTIDQDYHYNVRIVNKEVNLCIRRRFNFNKVDVFKIQQDDYKHVISIYKEKMLEKFKDEIGIEITKHKLKHHVYVDTKSFRKYYNHTKYHKMKIKNDYGFKSKKTELSLNLDCYCNLTDLIEYTFKRIMENIKKA